MGRRGAIYVRQSKTRERSESRSEQLKSGHRTAERFDVNVVAELIEPPSTSGYKNRGRNRTKWRELLDLIEAGDIDCVIVYTTARLTRGGIISYAELFDTAEKAGLDLDHLVLTPDGYRDEWAMSLLAGFDREESRRKSQYSKELHARLAAEGRYSGSGPRPFGYEQDGVTPHPVEADLVREAARRAADGEAWYSIAQDFQQRGIVGTRGRPMKPENLAKIVRSPRVAGKRIHQPDKKKPAFVVNDAWPAIVDLDDWQRIQRRKPGRPAARTNVFSGLAYCALCGHLLAARWSPGAGRRYTCPVPVDGGCGGVSVREHLLEDEIVGRLAAVVDIDNTARASGRRKKQDDPTVVVAELEERLNELAELFGNGEIGRGEWLAARQSIDRRLEAARRAVTRARRPREQDEWRGRGVELVVAWKAMTFPERRRLLEAWIDRIDLDRHNPAVTSGTFDGERVHVAWK